MNFATLRLVMLALIFAWAQVCCCQAGAVLDAAQRAVHATHQQVNSCCGGCPVATSEHNGDDSRDLPGLPCHDHGECGGCIPRAGSVPQGPTEAAEDVLGMPAPPVAAFVLIEFAPDADCRNRVNWGHRGESLDPPTLLRLHCALIV